MKLLHAFGLALQFLTRLPLPRCIRYSAGLEGLSVAFYPLVGLLIGVLLVLLRRLLGDAGPLLSSALLLTGWVVLTGGLHLDGLADCADAWVGGQGDRERSLRILQDPRSGPMGIIALTLILLLKFAALAEIPERWAALSLLLVPMVGRATIPALFLTTPYVRPQGLGSNLSKNLPRRAAWLAVGLSSGGALAFLGPPPVFAAILAVWWLRFSMLKRLGGCTGDAIGATVEIVEAVMLSVCALR